MKKNILAFFLSLIVVAACQTVEDSETKTVKALIIGNAYSSSLYSLDTPIRDAEMIADKLRLQGHQVLSAFDETGVRLERIVDDYISQLDRSDVALLYYSGHGVQEDGSNYLLTNDFQAVPINELIAALQSRADAVIVILDACRTPRASDEDNPGSIETIEQEGPLIKTRSIVVEALPSGPETIQFNGSEGVGLSEMELELENVFVAFSTAPNKVAFDKPIVETEYPENSPFAIAFSRNISNVRSFNEVMRATSEQVLELTNRRQVPWRQSSLVTEVYLNGKPQVIEQDNLQIPPL